MSFISINGKLTELSKIHQFKTSSLFEEEVIGFINDWQSGQKEFLQKTSGSTGEPKMIELTRAQMMASALLTIDALGLKPEQNSLLCLSPQYIGGKMMIVRSLINKMNLIAVEPSSNPFKAIDQNIHFAALTPMQMQVALNDLDSKKKISTVHNIILGGGPVSYALAEEIDKSLEGGCYSTYGMTETSSHIALKRLNGPDKSSYFSCFEDIEINQDERDCLTINGAVTNFETIITNDRVNLINANQFEWLGRIDNVINSGGIKIQSEKVERIIEKYFIEHGYDNRFFLTGVPDDLLGQKAILFIEIGDKTPKKSILIDLKDKLPAYHEPKDFLVVDRFAETPNGKINRKATIAKAI